MTFTLAYPPDRVNRTAEWEALSRQKPRTAALSTTTAEAPLSPPTYPPTASQPTDWTCTPSAIVPPGVDKRPRLGTRLAGPCELHGRCICEACRSAKRQPLLRLCCRRHHSASDPGMVDFCESHRRTPCARCQVIPSSADVCCRKGHHDAPPPHTSSFSLESGQPVNTSPNKASPLQLRTPVLRPSRRRPPGPRVQQLLLGKPENAAPSPAVSEPAAVLLGSPASSPKGAPVALAAAAAAAATATRKRLPVAEGTPPLHRKRRPPNACASTPQRRKPTILQLLGKRQRPPGASEDAAPPGPEAPQTGAWARAG